MRFLASLHSQMFSAMIVHFFAIFFAPISKYPQLLTTSLRNAGRIESRSSYYGPLANKMTALVKGNA